MAQALACDVQRLELIRNDTGPMPLRFTTRGLLWLILVVAMGLGWWADHQHSIKKWSSVHWWIEDSSSHPPKVHFSRGDTVDGAHKWQGNVEFPAK